MPPQSPPQPPLPRPAEYNEFADAVARMFEHRQQLAPDFSRPPRDDTRVRDDVDRWIAPRASWLSSLVGAPALRRVLVLVPLAVVGYTIAWFLYLEPSQNVTARPVDEARPETAQVAAPLEQSPPAGPQLTVAKPAPADVVTTPAAPAAVAAPVAPAAPAAPPVAAVAAEPSRPLTKDEIRELQGKLGAAGFTAGPIDGVVGPQTQAALRRYAESRSLAKPEANQETLLRLRSETQASQ